MILHDISSTIVHFGNFALFWLVDVWDIAWWVDDIKANLIKFAELTASFSGFL